MTVLVYFFIFWAFACWNIFGLIAAIVNWDDNEGRCTWTLKQKIYMDLICGPLVWIFLIVFWLIIKPVQISCLPFVSLHRRIFDKLGQS